MTDSRPAVRNPWAWVPSLYFAESIPYVMVMTVSVIMYKRLGISNTDIAYWTSWLYLPWVIKPLWSPTVDLFGTKRRWVVVMQAVLAVLLAAQAFALPLPTFFQMTLAVFWFMAFSSATHDIAADGFYMLGLQEHQQAAFVGVRSTFYRIGTIAAQGLLVVLAGWVESGSGLAPVQLAVNSVPGAANTAMVFAESPTTAPTAGDLRIVVEPAGLSIGTVARSADEVKAIIKEAREANIRNGFCAAEEGAASATEAEPGAWDRMVGGLEGFLKERFGEKQAVEKRVGNVGAVAVRLSDKPEPGGRIVALLNYDSGDESISVVEGSRLVFDEKNWDKPAAVVFQLHPSLIGEATAVFKMTSGNIPLAWSSVFVLLAVVFGVLCVYHKFILPFPAIDRASRSAAAGGMIGEFFRTFVLFFKKKDLLVIIAFLLFYRFAEAQLVKLVSPFLLDSREAGGLGLTTSEVGLAYGTVGIAFLLAGGLAGGYLISRQGLRFWLWPMVVIMHSPDLIFVFLSYTQPTSFPLITAAVAIEQFGYGFGFTAYMLYMIMVTEGEHKTAHFAICTGFMALGMMLPGMFSGWLQETIGYKHFFIWVVLSTIPGFLVAALVRIDPEFARKKT